MTTETNFNVSPYFDDFDASKNYHRILFRPTFPVQARELTQLQTILQNQIERFGQNIYKTGTIISGCSLSLDPAYNYVTLNDQDTDLYEVNVNAFANCIVRNANTGLQARIVGVADGYAASITGDKKTLYIKYIQNGSQTNAYNFGVGETLFVQTDSLPISSYRIISGGTSYSNGLIIHVTGTAYSVEAKGKIVTDSGGQITDVAILVPGEGYTAESLSNTNITIKYANGATYSHGGTVCNIIPVNYVSNPIVSGVGKGYAVNVSEGIIFQKGFFTRVDSQSIVVSKYKTVADGFPNNVVVGFSTIETIANSGVDSSLLDNAAGFENYQAPGAHRLKLTPVLALANADSIGAVSNTGETSVENFFSIAEFQGGRLVRDRTTTQFNSVDKELARRTYEESGNYVVDNIAISTEAGDLGYDTVDGVDVPNPLKDEVNVVIGRGVAYVQGHRNELVNSLRVPIRQASNTVNLYSPLSVVTSYENYFQVPRSKFYGSVNIQDGASIVLSSNNTQTVTSNTIPTISNIIGTARVRGIQQSGLSGSITTDLINIYVYDIKMDIGYSVSEVKALGSNGAFLAFSTPSLEINNSQNEALVFNLNTTALANISSTQFTYRKYWSDQLVGGSGSVSVSTGVVGETFLKRGTSITLDNKADFLVIAANSVFRTANLTGTIASNSTGYITGSGTQFLTELVNWEDGLWLKTSGGVIARVTSVANNTLATWDTTSVVGAGNTANPGFANNATISPKFYNANTNGGGDSLTITLKTGGSEWSGGAQTGARIDVYASVVDATSSQITSKIANSVFVKVSNTYIASSPKGPWTIGVVDAYYLEGVWLGTGNSYANNETAPNLKDNFELITGQKDSYYGIASIRLKPGSSLNLDVNNNNLLLKVSHWTVSGAVRKFCTADSYPLANVELIPVFTSTKSGVSYDLRNAVDFRPYAAITVNAASVAANATVVSAANAATIATETVTLSGYYFPTPVGNFSGTASVYTPRIDKVVIDKEGNIRVIEGTASIEASEPVTPPATMALATLYIPPYPSLPAKEAFEIKRPDRAINLKIKQQRGYTMGDIQSIEERLERIEYYSTLSLLESSTQNLVIPSGSNASLERFKNGFFVEPMNDLSIANTAYLNFEIDSANSVCTPRFERVPLKLSTISSTNTYTHEDKLFGTKSTTLANTGNVTISYFNKPTKVRNLVEGFVKWTGTVYCWPPIDVTVTDNQSSTEILVPSTGNNVISQTSNTVFTGIDPYIRAQYIYLYVTGLIPGRRHYVFFDGQNVTNDCQLAHFPPSAAPYEYSPKGVELVSYPDDGRIGIAYAIPADTYLTGEKEIVVMDVDQYDSQDAAASIAKGSFKAFSSSTNTNTNIVRGDGSIQPQPQAQNSVIVTFVGSDPLSQTFTTPSVFSGYFINNVKVLFARTSNAANYSSYSGDAGVTLEIRKTVNGYPTGPAGTIARAYLPASNTNVLPSNSSAVDTSKYTQFVFDKPVFVESNSEYAIVLYPDGNVPDYLAWVGKTGDTVIGTTTTYNTQDLTTTGTMFQSTSGTAWVPVKDEDMVYEVNASVFNNSVGSVTLKPNNYEFLTFKTQLDAPFEFRSGQKVAQISPQYLSGNLTFTHMGASGNTGAEVTELVKCFSTTSPVANDFFTIKGVGTSFSTNFVQGDGILILRAKSTDAAVLTGANTTQHRVANVIGTALTGNTTQTPDFTTVLKIGDFIAVPNTASANAFDNGTTTSIRQVVAVNSSVITIDAAIEGDPNGYVNVGVFRINNLKTFVSTVNSYANATTMYLNNFVPRDFLSGGSDCAYAYQKTAVGTIVKSDSIRNKIWIEGSTADPTTANNKINASNATFLGTLINTSYSNSSVYTTNRVSVQSVDDIVVDYITSDIEYFQPAGTRVYGMFTSYYSSTGYSGGGTTKRFNLGEKTPIDFDCMVKSRSNEASGNSVGISINFESDSIYLSPRIMREPASIVIHSADINNDTTGENTVFGNALSKYVSTTAVLKEEISGEDLFIYSSVHRPIGTDVKMYAKIMAATDVDFDAKSWVELTCDQNANVYASSTNEKDFREYRYTFADMPPLEENLGSANTTNGITFTGSGTSWLTDLTVGDVVMVIDTVNAGVYDTGVVNSVSSDTSITLKRAIDNTMLTNLSVRKFTDKLAPFRNANTDIIEYYDNSGTKYTGFQKYAIKAVMLRDDNSVIPVIDDIRAIATST